jgi:hypothetical protein
MAAIGRIDLSPRAVVITLAMLVVGWLWTS